MVYLRRSGELTRREFGALSAGAGLSILLPMPANPREITESEVEVPTPDGVADCFFVHPSSGAHAGVIIWPDIMSLRPAFRQMGRRLAASGYSVWVINPYYRVTRAPVIPEGANMGQEETRNTVFPLAGTLSP